jgi:hypothetical protein
MKSMVLANLTTEQAREVKRRLAYAVLVGMAIAAAVMIIAVGIGIVFPQVQPITYHGIYI